jgi:hypothetical protein
MNDLLAPLFEGKVDWFSRLEDQHARNARAAMSRSPSPPESIERRRVRSRSPLRSTVPLALRPKAGISQGHASVSEVLELEMTTAVAAVENRAPADQTKEQGKRVTIRLHDNN